MVPAVAPARRLPAAALAALLLATAASAPAQSAPLGLGDALALAAEHGVANRAARAGRDAADAQRLAAWRGILPAVRLEAGYIRTTDPVGAFGTTLRQQRITPADFDPARLNFPEPLGNYAGAVVVEQPIVVADAWMASRAGARAAEGAERAARWSAVSTDADVVRSYYGAILAASRATTLDAAARAAHAHVTQAEHLLEAGLVTRSDALMAAVRAGEVDAALVEAQADSVVARRQLGAIIGVTRGTSVAVPAAFPPDEVSEALARDVLAAPPAERADVGGARASLAAAGLDVARTRATLLPRVLSFARRDLNSSARPFGGPANWTVGVMASWTPFTGAAELAEQRAARARREAARAQLDGALAQAEVDVERTGHALRTALVRLDIARRAVSQALEAHRIVGRKYEGGLATVVELLDASAAETQARLGLSAARFGLLTATADRLRATGGSPARLAQLDLTPAAR